MLDLSGPAEAFAYAVRHGAPFRVHCVSPTPTVRNALGLSVGDLEPLPDALPPGALVFLTGVMGAATGYENPESRAVVAWLRRVLTPQQRLACVCSAALLAGEAGLLDGRQCTTHHSLTGRLRELAPRAEVLEDRVFVEDGAVCTSAGVTTGIDLALHLIERHAGAVTAQTVARELVVWQRRTSNDPQISPWLAFRNHLHPSVHRVQDALSRAPERPWPLEELARLAHTSVRNLTRLFREQTGTTIVDYQQRIRAAQARQLLEDPRMSVEQVAERVGFGSARALRRVFVQVYGAPPRARRRSAAATLTARTAARRTRV
ncbi:helix-turn-helix domain-containing protein [Aggregicoccus sp. 17bor-14]|nr:helix-turn-helix domain-containing protein [Simulacricoccus sp. 17bor-14]MRI90543.1 helix-turn-helix domain-containing protein [Aggregicoccus sp. 17bor-14]